MNIQDTETLCKRIAEDADLLKRIIRGERENGRSLFTAEAYKGLEDLMKQASSDVDVAESDWYGVRDRVIRKKVIAQR